MVYTYRLRIHLNGDRFSVVAVAGLFSLTPGNDKRKRNSQTRTICAERGAELVALNDALNELAKLDERQSRVVELRFFGGLTEEEIAQVLKVSPRTVSGDWNMARAWLLRELSK